jgi:hypothetical protein
MAEQFQESGFFGRLKKLFSSQTILRRDSQGRAKVVDTDYRQRNTNFVNLRDRYTKLQRSFYEQQGGAQSMAYHQVRRELFRDYDAMDNDPIITSALDIYSDESTTKNEYGDVLHIHSSNDTVKSLLDNLFYDIINVEFNLWPWVRNMCKYGDFFLALEIEPGKGIINVMPYSAYNVERLEGLDPTNPNYVKFKVEMDTSGKKEYENYEMAHFRLLSDTNFLPYGKAMIEGGRRVWKQICLMEDAMMIHRIMRAPEKRIFKIDIGNIPPTEVDNYMQKIINKMKKVPFMDQNSGDYNLKYNMQNLTEDFFLPVRGGDSGTSIDNLSGLEYAAIEDIDYLKAKLFAALKIPKAFLGYEEDVSGKATLAAQDVRFARTIERIQKTIVSELSKVAIVHLAAQGIEDAEMINFELKLTNASTIYEQEKVNLWSEKVRLATDMKTLKMLSTDWIFHNVFGLSKEEMETERTKIINDIKDTFRYNSIEQQGQDPANPPKQTNVEEEISSLKEKLAAERNGQSTIDELEADKNKGGRPREGNTYGKDKHPLGRDPLGNKENEAPRKRDTRMESTAKQAKQYINGISSKKKAILKENEKKSNFLDENNLLDDTKI